VVLPDLNYLEGVRQDLLQKPGAQEDDEEEEDFHPSQLFHMYESLQAQVMSSSPREIGKWLKFSISLSEIRTKTETPIRDKKTRPADFDLIPLEQQSVTFEGSTDQSSSNEPLMGTIMFN
jgi:hypothetical protein